MKISTQIKIYVITITLSFLGLVYVHLNKLDEIEKLNEKLIECQTVINFIPGGDITNSLDSLNL
jgi:hypothetical protein